MTTYIITINGQAVYETTDQADAQRRFYGLKRQVSGTVELKEVTR